MAYKVRGYILNSPIERIGDDLSGEHEIHAQDTGVRVRRAAIRKAVEFLVASPFEHLEFKDDVISDIISARREPRRGELKKYVTPPRARDG